MHNFLKEIILYKKQILDIAKQKISFKDIQTNALSTKIVHRNFATALNQENKISLIAEIKKASPSKGMLRSDLDVAQFAKIYEQAGASAISVLTEDKYFLGNPAYIKTVRDVTTKIPILRKDFIIDEYQIYESKILEADAILLIAELLSLAELQNFLNIANMLELECLVEVHSKDALKKVLQTNAQIIGINNRNLESFDVDINTTLDLKKIIPNNKIVVSESGINSHNDIALLRKNNINAVLIGEAIVTADDPLSKIQNLIF